MAPAEQPRNPPTPKVFVTLPAYQEEAGLPELLDRWLATLRQLERPYHFVIVDDGSTDRTPEMVREFAARQPATVITHQPNQGLGPSIRDGLRVAAGLATPHDFIVIMDADNTHPPELLEPMLQLQRQRACDVVIASRYRAGAQVVGLPWHRALMSLGARALFQAVFPIRGVRDYTCGYRLYRAECVQAAFAVYGETLCDQQGFQCMADILLKLARMGCTFAEVGMVLRYDLKGGASAMRVSATVRRTMALMLRRRLARTPPAVRSERRKRRARTRRTQAKAV